MMLFQKAVRELNGEEVKVVENLANAIRQYSLIDAKFRTETEGADVYLKFLHQVNGECNDVDIEALVMMLEDAQNNEITSPK